MIKIKLKNGEQIIVDETYNNFKYKLLDAETYGTMIEVDFLFGVGDNVTHISSYEGKIDYKDISYFYNYNYEDIKLIDNTF